MGRLRDARDLEYHASARSTLLERRHRAGAVLQGRGRAAGFVQGQGRQISVTGGSATPKTPGVSGQLFRFASSQGRGEVVSIHLSDRVDADRLRTRLLTLAVQRARSEALGVHLL